MDAFGPPVGHGKQARPDRVSTTITRDRGHNAHVSDDRKTASTCHTHSLALLFDTSRSCPALDVELNVLVQQLIQQQTRSQRDCSR